MTDVALNWMEHAADAALDGADLLVDEGLETAVIVSLFCDARVPDGLELLDASDDRRGWWADAYADQAGDRTGSLLWTLRREKRVPETAERARAYAIESLGWMIEDGVASAVNVAASFVQGIELAHSARYPNEWFLVLEVVIDKPSGGRESFRYAYNWQRQLAEKI